MFGLKITESLRSRYHYNQEYTIYSIFVSALACSAGLVTGYDLGIGAGVTSMKDFEAVFFPDIYKKEHAFKASSPWCKFDSQKLQIYTSCFYLAGFVSSLAAGHTSRKYGRKWCIALSGFLYLAGAALTSGAAHVESGVAMLILGRIALGFGCGFGNTVVLVYAAECSPPQWRGRTTMFFQWCSTLGQLVAQLVNYGAVNITHNGWRLSYALAAVPALPVVLGGILCPETPSWYLEKGNVQAARQVLQRLRGQEDVELELQDMSSQVQVGQKMRSHTPWSSLFKRCYFPFLIGAIILPLVHQWCGNNAIVFYAPVLFRTLGAGRKSSLLRTVILGCSKLGAGTIGLALVDHVGRRPLLIGGGLVMVATQMSLAGMMSHYLGHKIPKNASDAMLAMICLFVGFFSMSWGPLGFSVSAEINPFEIRSSANGLAHALSMLFSFISTQTFLTMICHIRYWTFVIYTCIILLGVVYAAFFLPECKGLLIEEVHEKFQKHWFWRRWPPTPRSGLDLNTAGLGDKAVESESKPPSGSSSPHSSEADYGSAKR